MAETSHPPASTATRPRSTRAGRRVWSDVPSSQAGGRQGSGRSVDRPEPPAARGVVIEGKFSLGGSTMFETSGQGSSERKELALAFGERLQTLRSRRGLSVEEFERRFEVADVATLELGRREPRLSDILALSDGMKVTPNVLLNGFYTRQRRQRAARRVVRERRDRSAVG
jgi:Helix-turn-helix domain